MALPASPRLEAAYVEAGATLHTVALERLTLSGPRWRFVARYARAWPGSVLALARLARRLDVAVVHTNALHHLQGWAAALLARRPHVWHAREIVVQSGAALRLERALARRFATVVVAISRAVAAQLDPANVVVAYDRADPSGFDPSRAGRVRAALGIPDGAPLVAAASRLDTWKGIEVLLDAVPALRAGRPEVEVAVAGPVVGGKEAWAADLERRARAAGVRWLGRRDEMADLLADLDVFVAPSTSPEPWGLGIIEALASGCSVVATAAGGPVELLADVRPAGGGPGAGGGGPGVGRPGAPPVAQLVAPGDAAALAAAVLALLPPTTSAAGRRRRAALAPHLPPAPTAAEVLVAVAEDPAGALARLRQPRAASA